MVDAVEDKEGREADEDERTDEPRCWGPGMLRNVRRLHEALTGDPPRSWRSTNAECGAGEEMDCRKAHRCNEAQDEEGADTTDDGAIVREERHEHDEREDGRAPG